MRGECFEDGLKLDSEPGWAKSLVNQCSGCDVNAQTLQQPRRALGYIFENDLPPPVLHKAV
jgi:hypothetical protein